MDRSSLSRGALASRLFLALVASAWALFLIPAQVVRAEPSLSVPAHVCRGLRLIEAGSV